MTIDEKISPDTIAALEAAYSKRRAGNPVPESAISFEKSGASQQIDKIASALAKAQALFQPAAKNKTNPHLKSKYADLVSVTEAVKKPLADNGLSYVQLMESDRAEITCVTTLMHGSGQWIAGRLTLHGKDTSPQAMGSAITYARRYGLSAMLGIVTDEEDDGEAAQAKPDKAKDPKYPNISVSEPKRAEPPKKPAPAANPEAQHENAVKQAEKLFDAKVVSDTRKNIDSAPLADDFKDDLWDLVCQVWPSEGKHCLNNALKERKKKPVDFRAITVGEAREVHALVSELLGNDGSEAPF